MPKEICCISDLHGSLPELPDADLYLLAGDYCPFRGDEWWWYRDIFAPWVRDLAKRGRVIGVAGNHDELFEKRPDLVPRMDWTYLQDSGTEWEGYKVWGSPWQPRFYDWAFNLDEPELAEKWALIPDDTDILLLHGPPRGLGDQTDYLERIGSPSLLYRIMAIKPRLVVCGHNHEGYGNHWFGHDDGSVTRVVNAAHMDNSYRPVNPPIMVILDHEQRAAA